MCIAFNISTLPMVCIEAEAVFGFIAVTCVLLWPFLPTRIGALLTQGTGAGAFAIHFLLLGSTTAAVASCVALLQLLAVTVIRQRLLLYIAFGASLLLLMGLTIATWHGLPSVLASVGSLFATVARMQLSMTRMKFGFLIAGPFWVAHNILVGSVFGMTVDAVSFGSNIAALGRLLLRHRRKYDTSDEQGDMVVSVTAYAVA